MNNDKRQAFYKSREWEKFRRVVIAERMDESGFVCCDVCGKPIVKPYDLIVHHKKELTEANVCDANVALNPDNVECVHFKCHNQIHERFGHGGGGYVPKQKKVYIVYGSPCAGKSTWVRDVACEGDLIVDLDSIWECVSGQERYIKPDCLRSVVFEVRDELYDIIKYRRGKWLNAYIITGGALRGDRERLATRVGADELVFIDTPKDECLKKVIEDCERDDKWVKYIDEWFERYQA